jgi:hypothetical protein
MRARGRTLSGRLITLARASRLRHLLVLAFGALIGCSSKGGGPIAPPDFSPAEAARQAIAQYDKNGDGLLDAKELEQSPALKSALKELDKNKDGKLSQDEIADRLTESHAQAAILTVTTTVTLNDRPLTGAKVSLVPEKFMGPTYKPATGVTDGGGIAVFQVEGLRVPGVPRGFYRVEVSKKNGDQETIARRYNTETILGVEIGPDFRQPLVLKLTGS